MIPASMKLWRYNRATGYWALTRHCNADTAQRWLEVFSADEPEEHFRLSKAQPKGIPEEVA